ncbi:MAG TPA: penicillin-binding protein 2 [Caulobacter sp.]|nr:penicillin-binding protein 2 [Caulobacter sp.]
MSEPSIFFSEVNRRQGDFNRRAFLLGGITGLGLTALGGRLALLQVVETQRYEKLAASNQFNFRLVPPPRGRVLDRNGVVLASNRPNFRLMVAREADTDVDGLVRNLCQLVPIPEEKVPRLIKDIKRAPKKAPVAVMEDMTWEEFARVNVRAPELPGVTAEMAEVRVYPWGGAFAHVVGYVAKVTDIDIKAMKAKGITPGPLYYNPGFRIGKQGIEKAFDDKLQGVAGGKKVEVDARGRVVAEDIGGDIPAKPGQEIQLTLDADVQQRALEVFGEDSGGAVVMDIRTGDLLCMASAPSFDANRFVRGLTGPEYRALANYERKPLLDKCMLGVYPPGSTFKPVTAMACLEHGIDPDERVHCGGAWRIGNTTMRCHKTHGSQNLHDAIKNSCDVYFYTMSLRLGPDRIAAAATALGFGQIFDIGLKGGQSKGLVPSTAWKAEYYRKRNPANMKWFPGETPSYAIGQGALTVNALQLCVATARLANGRKALNPRLIRSIGGVEMPKGSAVDDLPFKKEHLDYVREGMAAVAQAGGTAFRASQLGLGDILMAGKTGTAQVRGYKGIDRKNTGKPWKYRDHGLFIAFAPYDDPRYAISVIVEHGQGGSIAAAPKAREIMRVALLKDPELRARIEKPLPAPDLSAGEEFEDTDIVRDEAAGAPPPPTAPTGPVAEE